MERSSTLPTDPPFTVEVDGRSGVLDQPAASWWFRKLSEGNWYGIGTAIQGLHLEERIADRIDPFDVNALALLAHAVVRHATGYDWPRAVRLAATAANDWPAFEAWASRKAAGLDLYTAPPRRALPVVYALLQAGCEKEQDIDRLNRRLDDPRGIPGMPATQGPKRAPWSAADEAAGFLDAAAAFGSPIPATGGGR